MSILEELCVHRYLNAEDTFTSNGASCMGDETYRAMREISSSWVDLAELQRAAGEALARLTHNEAAYVSAGAASALTLCAAAAVSGGDRDAFLALPDTTLCARDEVVLLTPQRNPYARSIAASGARLRWAGREGRSVSLGELGSALTPRTAAIFYFVYHGAALCPPLEDILVLASANGIPVFVDAAAQLPPAEILWKYTELGAELALFSGGKGLAGPQDSGLIVGKRRWVERFLALGAPHEGVCRGSKVTREAIAGLYTAVRVFLSEPEEERQSKLLRKCELAGEAMRRCGFTGLRIEPKGPVGQDSPRVTGVPDGVDAQTLREALRREGLLVGCEGERLSFHPQMMNEEQTRTACAILEETARRMKEV